MRLASSTFGVREMLVFAVLAWDFASCAPRNRSSSFNRRPATKLEIDPELLNAAEAYFRIPLHMEMDAYWLDEFHHCGDYLHDSLEEVCRMHYHGRLSRFRNLYYAPRHSRIPPANQTIDEVCCRRPCDRWEMKNFCGKNPNDYPIKESFLLSETLESLRKKMDAFWTHKAQYCDHAFAENITLVCDMVVDGRFSPLLIPDYTPANSLIPSRVLSPITEPQKKHLIHEYCCLEHCSRWTLREMCAWNPMENNPEPDIEEILKSAIRSETKPAFKPEIRSGTKPVSKPEIISGFKPVSEPVIRSGTKPVSKSEISSGTKLVSKPEIRSGTKPIPNPEIGSGTKLASKSEISSGTKPVSKPEIRSGTIPVSKSENSSGTKPVSRLEISPGTKPVPKPEISLGTKLVSKPQISSGTKSAFKPEIMPETMPDIIPEKPEDIVETLMALPINIPVIWIEVCALTSDTEIQFILCLLGKDEDSR